MVLPCPRTLWGSQCAGGSAGAMQGLSSPAGLLSLLPWGAACVPCLCPHSEGHALAVCLAQLISEMEEAMGLQQCTFCSSTSGPIPALRPAPTPGFIPARAPGSVGRVRRHRQQENLLRGEPFLLGSLLSSESLGQGPPSLYATVS